MSVDSTPLPFTAYRLRFELLARDRLVLAAHTGSALRGMLYRALMDLAGPVRHAGSQQLEFLPNDPVRFLMATLDDNSARGQDVPRPYSIEPPVWADLLSSGSVDARGEITLPPGSGFVFGMTLYARAMELFPYVILALKRAETAGLGRGRGRFELARVWAENPFTGQTQAVFVAGDQLVRVPDLAITHAHVTAMPQPAGRALSLAFLTPTTLRANKQPVLSPQFNVLIHRLIERLSELSQYAGSQAGPAVLPCLPATREEKNDLLRRADAVRVSLDATRWMSLNGYSARQQAPTGLSGFAGQVTFEADAAADFAPFMPLLRWGEIAHVGKHTVKGNGLFRILDL